MYHYPIAIEPGDDRHAYGVQVPDIPGCFSAGETFDEALAGAREAIALHLEGLAEEGKLPPTASQPSVFINDPQYQGFLWAVVSVDETPYLGKSEKLNVTLPQLLTKHIDDLTRTHPDFKNRSYFLQVAARRLIDEVEGSRRAI